MSDPFQPRPPDPTIDHAVTQLAMSTSAEARLTAVGMLIGAALREAARLREVIARKGNPQ